MNTQEHCQECGAVIAYKQDDGTVLKQKEHPVEHCLIYLRGELKTYKDIHEQGEEIKERMVQDSHEIALRLRRAMEANRQDQTKTHDHLMALQRDLEACGYNADTRKDLNSIIQSLRTS